MSFKLAKDKCFIIAEAGVNHNGRLSMALKMVDAAVKANVDAIKFQIFQAEELVTAEAPKAEYQKKGSPKGSQLEMLKKLELSQEDFKKLFDYCRLKKIMFLATPFDSNSADFLNDLGVEAFKISSGDLNNIPFLIQVAKYRKPLILSTGMSSLTEVKQAVKAIYSCGNKQLILLQCTSNYPTKLEDVNLRAMLTLKNEFKVPVGYSDHTKGLEISIAAVALGAHVIERHFTLDKNLPGPDHQASLDVPELNQMVKAIRGVEIALGDGKKIIRPSEVPIKKVARKSIVARVALPAGTIIQGSMLSIKRAGTGIEPVYYGKLIGKKIRKALRTNEPLSWSLFK